MSSDRPDIGQFSYFRETLLGRLRVKIFEKFFCSSGQIPTEEEQKKFIFEEHRKNPALGEVWISLLTISQYSIVSLSTPNNSPEDFQEILTFLESTLWTEAKFLEFRDKNASPTNIAGALVSRDSLLDDGVVYVVTLFDEESFPDNVGRLEIRASTKEPEPFLSILSNEGWIRFSRKDFEARKIRDFPEVLSILSSLPSIANQKPLYRVPPSEALEKFPNLRSRWAPEIDPKCDDLIKKVFIKEISCTSTIIPFEWLVPYDFNYCMLLSETFIGDTYEEIRRGERPAILVYWNGHEYVMSDDYPVYLSYCALDLKDVPVVIMGRHGDLGKRSLKRGGAELFPEIGFSSMPSYAAFDKSTRTAILKLRMKRMFSSKSDVVGLILKLNYLLANAHTKEKELHELLVNGIKYFDPTGSYFLSEVRLGKKYKMDLVIRYEQDNRRVLLIELERATHPIFTKEGRLRAPITHSLQQVDDWIRFWREHPEHIKSPLDPTVVPQGMVVAGRSKDLSADEKSRLLHINSNRTVQLITYDDLVSRIERYAISASSIH